MKFFYPLVFSTSLLLSGNIFAAEPVTPTPVTGTIESISAGRVTVRLENGSLKRYSIGENNLQSGDHIHAQAHKWGDTEMLQGIQQLSPVEEHAQ